MKTLLLALILCFALSAFAAAGKSVSYKSGDETVQAMLYSPDGKGPFPGIIVIHEFWGLNDWVKEQASKLADQGYVALAVDDLHAAFEFLKSQANVKKDRTASIGWCWGGGYSLDVALQEPTLTADVINYGHLAVDTESLKKINAAILGIFGGKDRGIPVEDVKKFDQQLKQMGKKVEIVIYPEAGHGFENPNNRDGYRADDAADAWKRTIDFLKRTLK